MEAAESVLLPPSECNVTWQFALCLILPTLKQENPAPMETGNDRPCNRNIRKNLSEWNSCCIFTTLDLPKLLNDAQIWGAFYFYTLWAFNLTRSIHTPLRLPPCWKTEVGTLGTPNGRSIISETLAITPYRFDKKLRLFLFNDIEKVEIALHSALTNIVTRKLAIFSG